MDEDYRNERTTGIFRPVCADCEEDIAFGDEYVIIDDVYYHVECLRNRGISEVLRLCGIDILEHWEDEIEESY